MKGQGTTLSVTHCSLFVFEHIITDFNMLGNRCAWRDVCINTRLPYKHSRTAKRPAPTRYIFQVKLLQVVNRYAGLLVVYNKCWKIRACQHSTQTTNSISWQLRHSKITCTHFELEDYINYR